MNDFWHLYLMAAMYVFAGILHFIKPKAYLRIMPRYLPNHKLLVSLSGVPEILLGLGLCFEDTKDISIYGIIAMLAVFLLVHFYMLSGKKASAGIPKWVLITDPVTVWTHVLGLVVLRKIKNHSTLKSK